MKQEKQTSPEELVITDEMTEQAKAIVKEGLDLFAKQTQQLAADLAAFNERHKQAKEKIQRGGYRTSGRII
jgi:hypothetical protein